MDRARAPSGILAAALALTLTGSLLWAAMLAGAWDLASGLLAARRHLDRAERALAVGSLREATVETLEAGRAATRARAGLDGAEPLLDVARLSPVVDRVLIEIPHLIAAADHASEAALGALAMARGALSGPDAVVVDDPGDPGGGSRVRLDRIAAIRSQISDARHELERARSELEAVDPRNLPRRLRSSLSDGLDRADETEERLSDAAAGLAILPDALGANGPRTYVLAMQNSAELRGTGGAILRFAFLSFDRGKGELLEAKTVYKVDRGRRQISIPLPRDAWYVRGIADAQRFGNANWSPDWPLSSRVTIRYAHATDRQFPEVAGVIAVDPYALRELLPGVGRVAAAGRLITRKNVVDFLLYKSYAEFPIAARRRHILNTLVEEFYEALLKPTNPTKLMRGMGRSLAEKHVQVWLANPAHQRFIERMNWDAAIEPAEGADYLYVVEQNVGGNKLNFVEQQEHLVNMSLTGRDARVSTEVRIHNPILLPKPRYWEGDSDGDHRPMVNVYVPRTAILEDARVLDGERLDRAAELVAAWPSDTRPARHVEKGKTVWSVVLGIDPLTHGAVRYRYRVPDVVATSGGRRVYRLVVQHQPKPNPERLTIRLRLPAGARDVRAPEWTRSGERLVWKGRLTADKEFEVSWR